MEISQNWRDRPITMKQADFLCALSRKSFSQLTRGEASDLIERWSEANERCLYDQDVLEENK